MPRLLDVYKLGGSMEGQLGSCGTVCFPTLSGLPGLIWLLFGREKVTTHVTITVCIPGLSSTVKKDSGVLQHCAR